MKSFIKKAVAVLISAVFIATCTMLPSSAFAAVTPIQKSSSSVRMTFVAWGDPQVSNSIQSRGKNVEAASKDLSNSKSKIDALVLAGDITENAMQSEYNTVYNYLADTGVSNFITATGNHDIRFGSYSDAKNKYVSFTNKLNANAGSKIKISSTHYSYSVKGYKFIVLGSDKTMLEESYISSSQLSWLDSQLKASASAGKPVFVIMHQPLKNTHGLPNTWGSSNNNAGTVGDQTDKIKNILNKYKNVVLITGHLHTGFGKYSYQKVGNIHSVNLPSVGIDNEDGTYNGSGLGYVTEVFDNKVVFRARNFATGENVSNCNITVNLDRVKSVNLTPSVCVYNGKVRKPKITLYNYSSKEISPTNYTVTYPSGRKNVGVYKYKITFKNAYAGNPTKYKTFTIKPKGTSIVSVSSKSKGFAVKWKKQTTQTTGYQIQYSASSKFTSPKTLTIGKNTTVSKSVSKLKSSKKYYVRVRTYKVVKVSGKSKRIYSSWSKAASVTTR